MEKEIVYKNAKNVLGTDKYFCSSDGRIWRVSADGTLVEQRQYNNGYRYMKVDVTVDGKVQKWRVNRLIYFVFNGMPKNAHLYHVHHLDKNTYNNKLENLECMQIYQHTELHKKDKRKPEQKFQLDLEENVWDEFLSYSF